MLLIGNMTVLHFPQKNISLVIMNIMTLTENVLFIFLPAIRMGIIIYFLIPTENMEYLGILGKKEIIVMEKNLIEKFESNKTNLNINWFL